jgi:fructokinase
MLSNNSLVCIYGEVLFDCFEGMEPTLGGAPFNVAWHLQAFGAQAHFLSAVGDDEFGNKVLRTMAEWGMDTSLMQFCPGYPTGTVDVEVRDNEPHYTIRDNVAWDHIADQSLPSLDASCLLYHGSLALRHNNNRAVLANLTSERLNKTFIDVNLREPWWDKDSVIASLQFATCAKLNIDELRLLSNVEFSSTEEDVQEAANEFRIRNNIVDILVTRGAEGAFVIDRLGNCVSAGPAPQCPGFVDAVGAGDAFSSIAIMGLLNDWGWQTTLARAQEFASFMVGQHGAICSNNAVYQDFKTLWGMR